MTGPPRPPAPATDERELLLQFIEWKRAQVAATAEGLTDDELLWTPDGRLLPIIGIINHLTHMEWRWIEGRYLGAEFPPRLEEFWLEAGTDGAAILDAYRTRARRTEAVVRAAPTLDVPCLGDEGERGPVHVVLGFDEPIDLRWVLLHVLEETAHHAGHADSTRELLEAAKTPG